MTSTARTEIADWHTQAVEASTDGILLTDGVSVLDCNAQALKTFRCMRSELIGQALRDLTADPHALMDGADPSATLAGTDARNESMRRHNGEHFAANVTIRPLAGGRFSPICNLGP